VAPWGVTVVDFHKSETDSWFLWASETIFEEKKWSQKPHRKKISPGAFKSWTCQHCMAFLQGGALPNKLLEDF
jgi:hypothetical protein